MHSMISKLIPIREACEILGVSIDTLRRWDKSGKLCSMRAGSGTHRYYRKEDIELFINDLFVLAKNWAFSNIPIDLAEDLYCQSSSIFQARLIKMETDLGRVKDLENFYPLLVAIAGEIGNNSFDHNLGNWPDAMGIFFGYDINKKIIVLADRGQGVLTTLKRVRPELKSHGEALKVAFTENISARAPESRGNGLKFVRRAISKYPFGLIFRSGNAKLEMRPCDNSIDVSEIDENFHGCLVLIKF